MPTVPVATVAPVTTQSDVVIVGAGILGLATARAMLHERPKLSITVVDKEPEVGLHQTGHNSGVLHSGIYYRPGSLKATLCLRGKQALEHYADDRGLGISRVGKLIVATRVEEHGRLGELQRRAEANGVAGLRELNAAEIREIEPNAVGTRALHAPETAIVDYRSVARSLADDVRAAGSEVVLGHAVRSVATTARGVRLETTGGPIEAGHLIGCAGLQSDRLARLAGIDVRARIIPFRGDYYTLRPTATPAVRGLVYPVPDPAFPFLGVHFTPTISGAVIAGPNAVLALSREGYRRAAFNAKDAGSSLAFAGLWRFAHRHWRMAAGEIWRDLSKRAFVADMQRYVPSVTATDVIFGPSGIRAQAMTADGNLVDDFLIQGGNRMMHVLNAPSPGATASLAIGQELARRAFDELIA